MPTHIHSQLAETVGRSRLLCFQTTMTLFSSKPECLFSSLFCVFPFFLSPQGVMAFTASNYRLYLSYISPYISADLGRHLKGQLIALWRACARPLKEKSRSGWRNSLLSSSSKHLHVHLPPPPSLSVHAILLSFLSLYSSFTSASPGSLSLLCHHTCHFHEQRRTKHIFVYKLFVFVHTTLTTKVNRYHCLNSPVRTIKLNEKQPVI